jgi:hypothetical protein
MRASVLRKGNCCDNAPNESFWGTLKQEMIHHRRFKTRLEAQAAIQEWIEIFYSRIRRHTSLCGIAPARWAQNYYVKKKISLRLKNILSTIDGRSHATVTQRLFTPPSGDPHRLFARGLLSRVAVRKVPCLACGQEFTFSTLPIWKSKSPLSFFLGFGQKFGFPRVHSKNFR